MKKASLFTAVALAVASLIASSLTTPVAAQDDGIFNNALLNRSQIKHNSPGALDPLSARNRYLRQKAARNRRARMVRNTRRSRLSSSARRTRSHGRTARRSSYRLRR